MEIAYKAIIIISGILLLIVNFSCVAKKKMDNGLGAWWTIMALVVIVFGIIFDFSVLVHSVRFRNLLAVYVFSLSLVAALYMYGIKITDLEKKNTELTIRLSIMKSKDDASEKKKHDT